jgi:hypothetical protein
MEMDKFSVFSYTGYENVTICGFFGKYTSMYNIFQRISLKSGKKKRDHLEHLGVKWRTILICISKK